MAIALISLGNENRRDDAIAAVVCQALSAAIIERLEYYPLGIHGEQIGEFIANKSAAIVVDAVLEPGAVGQVTTIAHLELAQAIQLKASHGFSWFQQLALQSVPVPVTFIGINVGDDGWGQGLSPELNRKVQEIVEQVERICISILEAQPLSTKPR